MERNTNQLRGQLLQKQIYLAARELAYWLMGDKCQLCSEDRYNTLTIDHIDHSGAADRKKKGYPLNYKERTKAFVRYVLQPDKYQLLCRNCNWLEHLVWQKENTQLGQYEQSLVI